MDPAGQAGQEGTDVHGCEAGSGAGAVWKNWASQSFKVCGACWVGDVSGVCGIGWVGHPGEVGQDCVDQGCVDQGCVGQVVGLNGLLERELPTSVNVTWVWLFAPCTTSMVRLGRGV